MNKFRLIAYYLPQYHPIPENDRWWGKGFTEWINVAKAKPLFKDHYQPHIPADLGFYDLRVPETRQAQAELAQQHGIEGFCYWHYWLGGGKLLLERPFEEVLMSGEPKFPFCLGWANHSWTGIKFGAPKRTLIEQIYPGMHDHEAHFYYLLEAFSDSRYITVDGKPLFLIFRPQEIPDSKRVMDYWRELALKEGLKGLHIVGADIEITSPLSLVFGCDAAFYNRHRLIGEVRFRKISFIRNFQDKYRSLFMKPLVYKYQKAMKYFINPGECDLNEYSTIVTNWDSTPRLGWHGLVLHEATPDVFRTHVKQVLFKVIHKPYENRIIFVKSWNEWAEGNHLEPDQKYGKVYLEVLKDEIEN